MALSGSVKSNAYNGRYIILSWSATQDVDNNTSTISWTLKGGGTSTQSGVTWYTSGPFKVVIDGTTVYSSSERIRLYDGTTVASGTKKISHNSDGTKSFTISISAGIYTSSVNCTGSETFTLNNIARATQPSVNALSVNVGESVTISMPRASSSYTHTLTYKLGSTTGTIGTGLGTSKSWTIPTSLASAIPNATSGTCKITCTTYNGTKEVGTNSVSFTVKVPNNETYQPTVTVSIVEGEESVGSVFDWYVKDLSKLHVTISASGNGGSSIASYYTTANGTAYYDSEFTTDVLTTSGNQTVKVKVTDSRGYVKNVSISITVEDYTLPVINSFSVIRCNSSGVESEDGNYAKVTINAGICDIDGNTPTYYIGYRRSGLSTYTSAGFSASTFTVNRSVIISGISGDYAYEFYGSAEDPFNKAEATASIGSAFTPMDFKGNGKGVAFGKVSDYDGLEVKMPLKVSGDIDYTPFPWVEVTTFGSNLITASTVDFAIPLRYRKIGKHVYIDGMIATTSSYNGSTDTLIFTLPEGYRPTLGSVYTICALANTRICRILVNTTGSVIISWTYNLYSSAYYNGAQSWVDVHLDFFTD